MVVVVVGVVVGGVFLPSTGVIFGPFNRIATRGALNWNLAPPQPPPDRRQGWPGLGVIDVHVTNIDDLARPSWLNEAKLAPRRPPLRSIQSSQLLLVVIRFYWPLGGVQRPSEWPSCPV